MARPRRGRRLRLRHEPDHPHLLGRQPPLPGRRPERHPDRRPAPLDLGAATDLVGLALGARHGCAARAAARSMLGRQQPRPVCQRRPRRPRPAPRPARRPGPAPRRRRRHHLRHDRHHRLVLGRQQRGQLTPNPPMDPDLAFSTVPVAVALDPTTTSSPTCTSTPACTFCDPTCATPTRLVAGADHTCAVFADAPPACWGHGGDGRLGRTDEPAYASPARAVFGPDLADLAAGGATTCALAAGSSSVAAPCRHPIFRPPRSPSTSTAPAPSSSAAPSPAGAQAAPSPARRSAPRPPSSRSQARAPAPRPPTADLLGRQRLRPARPRHPQRLRGARPRARPRATRSARRRRPPLLRHERQHPTLLGRQRPGRARPPERQDLAASPVVVHPTLGLLFHVALGPTTTCALTTPARSSVGGTTAPSRSPSAQRRSAHPSPTACASRSSPPRSPSAAPTPALRALASSLVGATMAKASSAKGARAHRRPRPPPCSSAATPPPHRGWPRAAITATGRSDSLRSPTPGRR